jgi:hypothetical protein
MRSVVLLAALFVFFMIDHASACVRQFSWIGQTVLIDGWQSQNRDGDVFWTRVRLTVFHEVYGKENRPARGMPTADDVYFELEYLQAYQAGPEVVRVHVVDQFEPGAFTSRISPGNAKTRLVRLNTVVWAVDEISGGEIAIPIELEIEADSRQWTPLDRDINPGKGWREEEVMNIFRHRENLAATAEGNVGEFIFEKQCHWGNPCPGTELRPIEIRNSLSNQILRFPDDSIMCQKE